MNSDQESLLRRYADAVKASPTWLGLTGAKDRERFWERHVLDAVCLNEVLPGEWHEKDHEALDVGTGNGVPGLVLAVMNPRWLVTLMDSDSKKIGFLELFCNNNAINNVSCNTNRAEISARSDMRERFSIVTCRALGKLSTALELTAPFVALGGSLIVSHGTSAASEVALTEQVANNLGLKRPSAIKYGEKGEGVALIYYKESATPETFPRRPGLPAKKPL